MKTETYEQMERRLSIRSWCLIAITLLMPLVPITLIYFLNS